MTSLVVHFCSAPLVCFVDALDSQPTTAEYFPGDRYIHVKLDLHVPVFLDSQKAKKIDLHKDVNAEKCFEIYASTSAQQRRISLSG